MPSKLADRHFRYHIIVAASNAQGQTLTGFIGQGNHSGGLDDRMLMKDFRFQAEAGVSVSGSEVLKLIADGRCEAIEWPPAAQFQYRAFNGFIVERTGVPKDTIIGTGDISRGDERPYGAFRFFEPAEGFEVIEAGHVSAKLQRGDLIAEPID